MQVSKSKQEFRQTQVGQGGKSCASALVESKKAFKGQRNTNANSVDAGAAQKTYIFSISNNSA